MNSATEFMKVYHCRPRYVWTGFLDWLAEQARPGPLPTPPADVANKPFWGALLLAAMTLLLAVAITARWWAPVAVAGMHLMGPRMVAQVSGTLAMGSIAAVALAVPWLAAKKLLRTVQSWCLRGWELEHGLRAPTRHAHP